MDILVHIAEKKIREAMERGEFDRLPGAGKPIELEDDSMIPEELRVAYRLLKNAGCIPPELELRKEIITLKSLIIAAQSDEERTSRQKELNAKLLRLNVMRKKPLMHEDFPEYRDLIVEKLSR